MPVWAQRQLDQLRRDLNDAEARAEEARLATSPEQSDTVVQPYGIRGPIGLGIGPRIRFTPQPIDPRIPDWRAWIDARVTDKGEVEFMAASMVQIRPHSGNVFTVEVAYL